MRFSILLPSAEGKAPGGNPLAPDMFDYRSSNTFNYFSELNPERRALIDALQAQVKAADDDELQKLFGVKGDTLAEAVQVTKDIYRSPLMASVDRYGPGVMYAATDFAGLPTGSQRRLLENGVILLGPVRAAPPRRPDPELPAQDGRPGRRPGQGVGLLAGAAVGGAEQAADRPGRLEPALRHARGGLGRRRRPTPG